MIYQKFLVLVFVLTSLCLYQTGCNYITHRTLSDGAVLDSTNEDPEPDYDVSLDFGYQDFVSYLFIGNRIENFTAYFNTFYKADEDFNEALDEYRTSAILNFNKRLDSLNQVPAVSGGMKEKLEKSIERASKIIQFHKNSKFIDKAVLLIGKSYYYLGDYFNAERKFDEFLSKLSSSVLADEALLFLGITKVRLGKKEEGINIFKDLVQSSSDNEIKSLAARELGVNAYDGNQFDEAVRYFKVSNDFTNNSEVKAEGQYILAKIISYYKPEHSAKEYLKVLDHTSDFDLSFFARLNYAKGLIHIENFNTASEILAGLRKKYRDVTGYTQLIDLEMANNLYGMKDYKNAKEKYYEVIVKYPNTQVSSDAYYFLAKHDEEDEKNYLRALINYKKAVEESTVSDYHKESSDKAFTFDRYFILRNDLSGDTNQINIPLVNAEVEKFRKAYNEDQGLQTQQEENKKGEEQNKRGGDEEGKGGDGKGKPGGEKISDNIFLDSLEVIERPLSEPVDSTTQSYNKRLLDSLKDFEQPTEPIDPETGEKRKQRGKVDRKRSGDDTLNSNTGNDSLNKNKNSKAVNDSLESINKEERIFNAYYELAELFMYSLRRNDSAEIYLKILLDKYPQSDKQAKVLYTLGNFYKNSNKKSEADETFKKIISTYPHTIYAYESKKILGLKTDESDIARDPVDEIFDKALLLFDEKKYTEAIIMLEEIQNKYPDDSLVAKSLYSIGWIYENNLSNKDSSIMYYKKLKEKFPESEYTVKISPVLEYIASVEPEYKSDTARTNLNDTTMNKVSEKDSAKTNEQDKENVREKENAGEVNADTTGVSNENRLSPEEIEKLLKESEGGK